LPKKILLEPPKNKIYKTIENTALQSQFSRTDLKFNN